MNNPYFTNISIAILLMRIVTGILFLFQGYDKLFRIGISKVVDTFRDAVKRIYFPGVLLMPAVFFTTSIEFVAGGMLIVGLFREWMYLLLAFDLIAVALMFSSFKAMWDMEYYFPRLVLIVALLSFPIGADIFCLDRLF